MDARRPRRCLLRCTLWHGGYHQGRLCQNNSDGHSDHEVWQARLQCTDRGVRQDLLQVCRSRLLYHRDASYDGWLQAHQKGYNSSCRERERQQRWDLESTFQGTEQVKIVTELRIRKASFQATMHGKKPFCMELQAGFAPDPWSLWLQRTCDLLITLSCTSSVLLKRLVVGTRFELVWAEWKSAILTN